jgi:hypothetical protein
MSEIIEISDIEDQFCPICFEEIKLLVLTCSHRMCSECYFEWHYKLKNTKCCICRQDVDKIITFEVKQKEAIKGIRKARQFAFICFINFILLLTFVSLFINHLETYSLFVLYLYAIVLAYTCLFITNNKYYLLNC